MVIFAKIRETWYGKVKVFWKTVKDVKTLKKDVKNWNMIQPEQQLTVLETSKTRPVGLVKTKYKGIYHIRKKKSKPSKGLLAELGEEFF